MSPLIHPSKADRVAVDRAGIVRREETHRRFIRDDRGAALIEMAVVTPVLAVMMLAVMQFGVVMNNRVVLAESVGAAARTLSLTRGTANPCSTAAAKLKAAASTLGSGNITITVRVNDTNYTAVAPASPSCAGAGTLMAAGDEAIASATYPCSIGVLAFSTTTCLSSSTSVRVE